MRFVQHLLWNIKFQARYGFYLLYGLLTLLYTVLLINLPQFWKEGTAAILVFSDPAAMGLFFMGAIVLLEKSQRVTSLFAVSPLTAFEYVSSKVLSLSSISLFVAMVLAVASKCMSLPLVMLGTFLSSILFTLFGVIIATKITSLNQFILATVPIEIFTFGPAILHLFGITPSFGRIYPTNVCMDLIAGRDFSILGMFFTVTLIVVMFFLAYRCVLKMWQEQGGARI